MSGLLEEGGPHQGKGEERCIHSLKVIVGLELQACLGQTDGADCCHWSMPFLCHSQVSGSHRPTGSDHLLAIRIFPFKLQPVSPHLPNMDDISSFKLG